MKKVIYKKTIDFGKIAYTNKNHKENKVEIEFTLSETESGLTFSASCNVWNARHTDIEIGGQCIDTVAVYFKNNKLYNEIKEVWEKYHLNDMHAGCIHQREFEKEPYENHKDAVCDICNYKYGSSWIFEPIPENVIEQIKSW